MSNLVLQVAWFLAFLLSLITSNSLCLVVKGYISSQPAGNLSLFVLMVKDIFTGIQFHSSTHCLLGMVSRLELVTATVADHRAVAVVVGTFAELVNTTTLVHLGSFCVVRILCLKYISFMEETLGERVIRLSLFCISFAAAGANCAALIASGDILNGTVYNMMTNTVSVSGKSFYRLNSDGFPVKARLITLAF